MCTKFGAYSFNCLLEHTHTHTVTDATDYYQHIGYRGPEFLSVGNKPNDRKLLITFGEISVMAKSGATFSFG